MSGTAIAISTAQSSAAISVANAAKRDACGGYVTSFDAKNATIDAMKHYADCVNLLHPDGFSDSTVYFLKICLIISFIGSFCFFYAAYSDSGVIEDCIIGLIGGFLFTGFACLMTGALFTLLSNAVSFLLG